MPDKPKTQTKEEIERDLKAEHNKLLENEATAIALQLFSSHAHMPDAIYISACVLANLLGNWARPDTFDSLLRDTCAFVKQGAQRTATVRQAADLFVTRSEGGKS